MATFTPAPPAWYASVMSVRLVMCPAQRCRVLSSMHRVFYLEPPRHEVGQVPRRAREALMPEGVRVAGVVRELAHVPAVFELQPLGYGDDHGVLLIPQGAAYLLNEALHVEGRPRQADHIRIVFLPLRIPSFKRSLPFLHVKKQPAP
jgi:hypothetical protein